MSNPGALERIKGIAELRQKYLIGKAYPGKESAEKRHWLCSLRPLKYFKGMNIDLLMGFWWLKMQLCKSQLVEAGRMNFCSRAHVRFHCLLCEVEL